MEADINMENFFYFEDVMITKNRAEDDSTIFIEFRFTFRTTSLLSHTHVELIKKFHLFFMLFHGQCDDVLVYIEPTVCLVCNKLASSCVRMSYFIRFQNFQMLKGTR
jgi:hypothetical protein